MITRIFCSVFAARVNAFEICVVLIVLLVSSLPQTGCYGQGIAGNANALIGVGSGAGGAICRESTNRLFSDENNPNLQSSKDAYLASVSDLIETECLIAGTNELQSCVIDLDDINFQGEESEYPWECIEGSGNNTTTNNNTTNSSDNSQTGNGNGNDPKAGVLWKCSYQPQCSPSGSATIEIRSLLICSSPRCSLGGVTSTLMPHASLLGPLSAAGHACAAIFRCTLAFEP